MHRRKHYVVTAITRTIMGQVVCANTPVCYSQTGMLDIVMCRGGNIITINWIML